VRAWDYPKDQVVIVCTECKRRGRYSKERFIKLVGRDTSLPDALRIIASSCPKSGKEGNILHDRCKAHYANL